MTAPDSFLKRTPWQDHAPWGDTVKRIGQDTLSKIAATEDYIPPRIEEAIRWIGESAKPGFAYLLDRALGAEEYYGANNNGDGFPEAMLIRDHPTFEKHAHVYRHHKTFEEPTGNVLTSAWNDRMRTVDLIMEVPLNKVAEEISRLGRGLALQTSMGCSVPYDVCSYCGNKASTRALYCGHLRQYMLRILNGKQVFAINPLGVFKDISFVFIPAAAESAVFSKIASPWSEPAQPLRAARKRAAHEVSLYVREGEYRGAVRPVVIQSASHLKTASSILTLHNAIGLLRPDEYVALLRKDASALRPDVVPLVRGGQVEPGHFGGVAEPKLASVLGRIEREAAPDSAVWADWISEEETASYLRYRASIPWSAHTDNGLFVR